VDDAVRVDLGHPLAGLEDVEHRLLQADAAHADHAREVAPLEQLHHDEREALLARADVEHPGAVLTADALRGARLQAEARDRLRVVAVVRVEHLDRDPRAEADAARLHDDPHAAAAEQPRDLVLPGEHLPRLDAGLGSLARHPRREGTTRPRPASRPRPPCPPNPAARVSGSRASRRARARASRSCCRRRSRGASAPTGR